MRLPALLTAALALSIVMGATQAREKTEHARIFGWVEKAEIEPWGVEIKAKLDSGALTSSMHARDIERFEKDDEDWVRFTVDVEDTNEDETVTRTYERPLFRNVKIRGAGGTERRPVVLMKLCMGQRVYEEQFSLENRGDMNYPLLIGRRTIQHLGLLDVTATFLHEPSCDDDSPVSREEGREDDEDIGS